MLSIFALSSRANTGAAPPEDTAAIIGDRSIIAGKMKLQSAGLSTTFTKIFCCSAVLATRQLVS